MLTLGTGASRTQILGNYELGQDGSTLVQSWDYSSKPIPVYRGFNPLRPYDFDENCDSFNKIGDYGPPQYAVQNSYLWTLGAVVFQGGALDLRRLVHCLLTTFEK